MTLLLILLILLLVFGAGLVGFVIKSALIAILLVVLAAVALGYLAIGSQRT